MIDSNYNGKVFNITLADVPVRKNDLVEGNYVVDAKKGATVAVKGTDMLGEEVLVVKQLWQVSRGAMQFPHGRILYPYKFAMSRILTH